MSDLISRQALMKRISEEYHKYGDDYDALQILGDIEDFPSAETPTVSKKYQLSAETSTNTSIDLISRQDVLNMIIVAGECEPDLGYTHLHTVIESLPSADRPTGECRTCKRNADNGGFYEDGRTKCPIQEHYALLLDGYCHLYEQI